MLNELGVSAAEFGRTIGVSGASVGIWRQQAECRMEPRNLFRIETRFGYRARWIALGEEPRRVSDPSAVLSQDEEAILEQWRLLSLQDRQVGIKLLDALPKNPSKDVAEAKSG